MARPLRIEFENAHYHITARGNEKRAIFSDDTDRKKFLSFLEKYVDKHGIVLYCYVLMNNHYHLFLSTPRANLSEFMHSLQSHYTGWYNNRHERCGHLFQGRYKSLIVDSDAYLVELSRYIHLNPVRAGLAQTPETWKWSSYPEYIRERRQQKWIDRDGVLAHFSRNESSAIVRYCDFVNAAMETAPASPLMNVKSGLILGSEDFAEGIRGKINRDEIDEIDISHGRAILCWTQKDAEAAIEKLADYFEVEQDRLLQKKCGVNWSRDVAIWLFVKNSRWRGSEIGALFGVSFSAVGKTAKRVEAVIENDEALKKELSLLRSNISA